MSDNTEKQVTNFVDMTSDLVAAYVSNNSVRPTDLPDMIRAIHTTLTGLANASQQPPADVAPEKPTAAQIRKSVQPNGIVSFLDGKTYKTLKRHLTAHGVDPQSYRARFGLSADYPMVAPEYAARRSELAKSIGLGRIFDRSADEQSPAKGRKKAA